LADGFGLRQQLDAKVATARRSLLPPALLRAAGPALLWLAAFTVFWMTGLNSRLPLEAQAAIGVVFWLGLAVAVWWGFARWRKPTDAEGRARIDAQVEGRPMSVWADRPARADEAGWKLWAAHRDRMAALVSNVRRFDVSDRWRAEDPWRLRFIVPVLVLAAVAFANVNAPGRMGRGLAPDFGALFGAHKLAVEAWITPPPYTGAAPFVLTAGQSATAPEGSEVTLRIISPGQPAVKVDPVEGPTATQKPAAGVDGAYESKVIVNAPMTVKVDFWGTRAAFPFTVKPNGAPVATFKTPPKLGQGDRTEFEYKVTDDYGVQKLELVARLAHPPEGAENIIEAVPIPMSGYEPKEEEGEYSQDLVRHRWAGLDVMVRLRATDAAGRIGESAEVAYKLPEKIFLQPLSRSAQEIRASVLREWRPYAEAPSAKPPTKPLGEAGLYAFETEPGSRLKRAPEGVKQAAVMLEAVTYEGDRFFDDPVIYMGFAHALGLLESAKDFDEARQVDSLLWDIALRAEYGSVADARAALEAARRALENALRNGASEEEIKRLMDMYAQAVENYMAAQMAEALRDGRVQMGDAGQQQQGGGGSMGDDEMQRMLDALRDLAETGATDQARQLLSDMSRMLEQFENMQLQMSQGDGQQQEGPMSRALNRALQDTNRAMNDQRDLNDMTDEAQRGDPSSAQELADRQRQLRERLEQQMRSGGGDPRQEQGQQGQEGQQGQQGQQGEGQQGQGQQGQGQQGQGQQGQGQPGQGQQGQNGGNANRPGAEPGGQGGRENERSRALLGQALEAQRRAEEALRRGDFDAARRAQQEAMGALQSRSGELARLDEQSNPDARRDDQQRDILGRLNEGEDGFGDNVKVPDEIERQRARDILDEIRRRAGDRTLRQEDLEYLRRLLERF
jgi:hypothetical protein